MTQLSPTPTYKHYIPTKTELSPNMTNIFAHIRQSTSSFSGDNKKQTQILKKGTIKLLPLSADTTCTQLLITYTMVLVFYSDMYIATPKDCDLNLTIQI